MPCNGLERWDSQSPSAPITSPTSPRMVGRMVGKTMLILREGEKKPLFSLLCGGALIRRPVIRTGALPLHQGPDSKGQRPEPEGRIGCAFSKYKGKSYPTGLMFLVGVMALVHWPCLPRIRKSAAPSVGIGMRELWRCGGSPKGRGNAPTYTTVLKRPRLRHPFAKLFSRRSGHDLEDGGVLATIQQKTPLALPPAIPVHRHGLDFFGELGSISFLLKSAQ